MSESFLSAEPTARLAVFLGMLLLMVVWEIAAPRRRQEIPRLLRWTNNIGIVVIDTILVRLAFPVVAVGLAIISQERGWGFFNIFELPGAGFHCVVTCAGSGNLFAACDVPCGSGIMALA